MAYISDNKGGNALVQKERAKERAKKRAKKQRLVFLSYLRSPSVVISPAGWGNNSAISVLHIAETLLEAKWEQYNSHLKEALALVRSAAQQVTLLKYDEPDPWFVDLASFL